MRRRACRERDGATPQWSADCMSRDRRRRNSSPVVDHRCCRLLGRQRCRPAPRARRKTERGSDPSPKNSVQENTAWWRNLCIVSDGGSVWWHRSAHGSALPAGKLMNLLQRFLQRRLASMRKRRAAATCVAAACRGRHRDKMAVPATIRCDTDSWNSYSAHKFLQSDKICF